jgi:hypothetical protein
MAKLITILNFTLQTERYFQALKGLGVWPEWRIFTQESHDMLFKMYRHWNKTSFRKSI